MKPIRKFAAVALMCMAVLVSAGAMGASDEAADAAEALAWKTAWSGHSELPGIPAPEADADRMTGVMVAHNKTLSSKGRWKGCHKEQGQEHRHFHDPGASEPVGECREAGGTVYRIPYEYLTERVVEVEKTIEKVIDPTPEILAERDAALRQADRALERQREAQAAADRAIRKQGDAEKVADRESEMRRQHERKLSELLAGQPACSGERQVAEDRLKYDPWGDSREREALRELLDCLKIGERQS